MNNYIKLPFNFKYNENNVLLVNQVGEHLFVSYDDFDSFVHDKLDNNDNEVENVNSKEVEVYDYETGEYRTFDMD